MSRLRGCGGWGAKEEGLCSMVGRGARGGKMSGCGERSCGQRCSMLIGGEADIYAFGLGS